MFRNLKDSGSPGNAKQVSRISTHGACVSSLRELAVQTLARMYRPQEGVFAFRLRRKPGAIQLEGVSGRYTAIALIGLARAPNDVVREVLGSDTLQDVCSRLLSRPGCVHDLGEAALALWAARQLDHPGADTALRRLQRMSPHQRPYPTVELSWALTALVVDGSPAHDERLMNAIAARLLDSFQQYSGVFPHWSAGASQSKLRGHIACFADFVYPIQALAHYHQFTGCRQALETARRAAEVMCAMQGPDGQWWWHYDIRTGRVVERFPVYAVHQDAMAPMALFALQEAAGEDAAMNRAIVHGLDWLISAPELVGGSLIDEDAGVIWRKVARHEPGKIVRGIQAGLTRVHPSCRLPWVDRTFPPGRVDYECRPYHLGWLLYAWDPTRLVRLAPQGSAVEGEEVCAQSDWCPVGVAPHGRSEAGKTDVRGMP